MNLESKKKKKKSVAAERIRKAFERSNELEVEVIPATKKLKENDPNRMLRVCAYCRVSTLEESQDTSYELQRLEYEEFIRGHENWEFSGVYGDKESGTSVRNRTHFLEMIKACRAGEIDLIITKSISRFARNVLDCLAYVRELKQMSPPIGIYFETEHLNTLDPASEMTLHVLSLVAPEESSQKSKSLKWSYRKRFERGIPLTNMWAVLG